MNVQIKKSYQVGQSLRADQVRAFLERELSQHGTQADFALQAGCSRAFVNDILRGNREPSGVVLQALGLERIVRYVVKP